MNRLWGRPAVMILHVQGRIAIDEALTSGRRRLGRSRSMGTGVGYSSSPTFRGPGIEQSRAGTELPEGNLLSVKDLQTEC